MSTLFLVPSPLELAHLIDEGPSVTTGVPQYQIGTDTWSVCGIGPAAAAFTAGHLIDRLQPEKVILLGIAGAFAGSGHKAGDVVQAKSECFADLGYRDGRGYHTLDEMKLPVLPLTDGHLGCHYPVALLDEHQPAGAFVTVSAVTNDADTASLLAGQFQAVAENMEGAAVALACKIHQCPFYQVRAVSNMVGPRDPSSWLIKPALANLRAWIEARH